MFWCCRFLRIYPFINTATESPKTFRHQKHLIVSHCFVDNSYLVKDKHLAIKIKLFVVYS